MKIYFITEDNYGPQFIKKLLQKKQADGLFLDNTFKAKRIPHNSKLTRVINSVMDSEDRIIILADGDGNPIEKTEGKIKPLIPTEASSNVEIVVFANEIHAITQR